MYGCVPHRRTRVGTVVRAIRWVHPAEPEPGPWRGGGWGRPSPNRVATQRNLGRAYAETMMRDADSPPASAIDDVVPDAVAGEERDAGHDDARLDE